MMETTWQSVRPRRVCSKKGSPHMQSRNPILNNSDTFNGQAARSYGHEAYAAGGQGHQGYGQQAPPSDPSSWTYPTGQALEERMTLDSVVMRSAMTLGLVIITGALTWVFLPDDLVSVAWIGGALAGVALGLFLSFQRVVNPPLVLL